MTTATECRHCYGLGRLHTRNGDPDDDGETCPKCGGAGVVPVELELEDEGDG